MTPSLNCVCSVDILNFIIVFSVSKLPRERIVISYLQAWTKQSEFQRLWDLIFPRPAARDYEVCAGWSVSSLDHPRQYSEKYQRQQNIVRRHWILKAFFQNLFSFKKTFLQRSCWLRLLTKFINETDKQIWIKLIKLIDLRLVIFPPWSNLCWPGAGDLSTWRWNKR